MSIACHIFFSRISDYPYFQASDLLQSESFVLVYEWAFERGTTDGKITSNEDIF